MKKGKKIAVAVVCLLLFAALFMGGAYLYDAYRNLETGYALLSEQYAALGEENDALSREIAELRESVLFISAVNDELEFEIAALQKQEPAGEIPPEDPSPKAYLTFDDGPSVNTEQVLNILAEKDVKATFFVVGRTDDFSKGIYKKILEDGHALAIHTMTHRYDVIYKSVDAFKNDIKALSDLLFETTGYRPSIMRFAGGSNNTISKKYGGDIMKTLVQEMPKEGYTYFDWNVDSGDALSKKLTASEIEKRVLEQAAKHKTPVILMHDAKPKEETVKALPGIIDGLRARGFSFEVLTENGPDVRFKK